MNSIKYLSNVHTHTHLSDGHATLEEMVEYAYKLGFVSIGITDHCPVFYNNDFPIKDIGSYIKDINTLKNKYLGKMEILCGIELDDDCNVQIPKEISYVISSVHTLKISNGEVFRFLHGIDNFKRNIEEHFSGDYYRACAKFFDLSYKMSIREESDIIGHFDCFTKYNFNNCLFDENDKRYLNLAFEAIDGIFDAKKDAVFELNTGGMIRAGKMSPYPSPNLLKRIYEKNGRIIVNSDAHKPEQINAGFNEAFEILRTIGFKSVLRLRENGFEELSLEE